MEKRIATSSSAAWTHLIRKRGRSLSRLFIRTLAVERAILCARFQFRVTSIHVAFSATDLLLGTFENALSKISGTIARGFEISVRSQETTSVVVVATPPRSQADVVQGH